jgi:hypothetical protein
MCQCCVLVLRFIFGQWYATEKSNIRHAEYHGFLSYSHVFSALWQGASSYTFIATTFTASWLTTGPVTTATWGETSSWGQFHEVGITLNLFFQLALNSVLPIGQWISWSHFPLLCSQSRWRKLRIYNVHLVVCGPLLVVSLGALHPQWSAIWAVDNLLNFVCLGLFLFKVVIYSVH